MIKQIRVQYVNTVSTLSGEVPDSESVAMIEGIDEDGTVLHHWPVSCLVFSKQPRAAQRTVSAMAKIEESAAEINTGVLTWVEDMAATTLVIITDQVPGELTWNVVPLSAVDGLIAEIDQALAEAAELTYGAVGGEWRAVRDDPEELGWFVHGEFGAFVTTGYVGNRDSGPTAKLIAALRRTLPTQIAILNAARNELASREPGTLSPIIQNGLVLARQLVTPTA